MPEIEFKDVDGWNMLSVDVDKDGIFEFWAGVDSIDDIYKDGYCNLTPK